MVQTPSVTPAAADKPKKTRDWRTLKTVQEIEPEIEPEAIDDEPTTEPVADAQPASRADFTELTVASGPCRIADRVRYRGHRHGLVVDFVENPDLAAALTVPWLVRIEFDDGGATLYDADPAEVVVVSAQPEPIDRANLYPVPTEIKFGGKETMDAPDLRTIGQNLVATCEEFKHLIGQQIDYLWVAKGGSANGEANLGVTRNLSKFERRKSNATKMVTLSADHLAGLLVNHDTVTALVHERLCAIGKSKKGKLYIKGPDFRGYTPNVSRFGAVLPKTRAAALALARDVADIRNGRLPFEDQPEDEDIEDAEDTGV